MVIICLGAGASCLALLNTTVFLELVSQAEKSGRFEKEVLYCYLSSLFTFLTALSQVIAPFLANLFAAAFGYTVAYVIGGLTVLTFSLTWAACCGMGDEGF